MADVITFADHGGSLGGSRFSAPVVEEGHDDGECEGLEPFFYDEAEAVADHERRVRIEEEEARMEDVRKKRMQQAYDRIRDYDPKQGGHYFTRLYFADFREFDIDEESTLGQMRHTNTIYKQGDFCPLLDAISILSVKIASLDVDFPIHVYGTVIGRDSLDSKCVYVFRHDRDNCQVIKSKTQPLILEGPKRGLVLLYDVLIEIDLKIRDVQLEGLQQVRDRELSKGFVKIKGSRSIEKCLVESKSLATRLSTVEVRCSVVKDGLEALVAIKVLQGSFSGKITACTSNIPHNFLLYDNKLNGKKARGVKGVVQLLQPVITVGVRDMLVIVIESSDGTSKRAIEFTPRHSTTVEDVVTVGATKMCIKVSWSILHW